jgi:chromosome segregation protein
MKFTKLRLVGFKSFVEPSEFVIERGLTGVVGPNGCGKSNLVEAMRWVMGENSYKNMRASGMDDVIFSGSGNRPARNTAEVGLYLDNSDRSAPAGFNDQDEIQVTRRIERENGSVYRINGREARAKDVQLLFADASTGARSPSMVGQGRIGELIQAKPQARRQLLEEAAGISGLHSRRHEAELRLRAAETNLERLDDVTSELESQIESLKRQARQASRFKQLSAEIREGDATLLHLRWVSAKAAEAEAASELAQATSEVAARAQRQMEAAKAQAVFGLKLPELRDADAAAAAALQRLQIARSQLNEDAERTERQKADLERRMVQLQKDIAREEQLVGDNAASLQRLEAEEAELTAALDESDGLRDELADLLARAIETLEASEAVLSAATAKRAEAAAERTQYERAIRELFERRQRHQRQLEQADQELAQIAARLAELPDPAEKAALVEAAELEAEVLSARSAEAEEALDAARACELAARPSLEEAKRALSGIETEARTIRKMLAASAGDGDFSPLLDQVTAERGYETALGAVLGDDLDRPLDPRASAHWRTNPAAGADPALPEGVVALAAHVDAPEALRRRLAQIGVVADETALDALQPLLKAGQRLVTRAGAVRRWDGYVASAEAPSAAALRLAQRNRLLELEAEALLAAEVVERQEALLAEAQHQVAATTEALRRTRETMREAAQSLDRARQELAAAERAAGDHASRRAVLDQTRSQTAELLDEVAGSLAEAEDLLAAAPDLASLEAELQAVSAVVARDRSAMAEVRARRDGLEREIEARRRRLGAIAGERTAWLERAANADRHIAELKLRHADAIAEAERIEAAPDDLEQKRRALLSALSKAEAERRDASDRLAEADTKQREADRHAVEAMAALAQMREQRGRAEERLHAARDRRADVEGRIRNQLHCAPHEAFRLTGLTHDAPLPDPAEIDRKLERLKLDRERLGAVNLRAEEEVRELSERLDAIVKEREDVIEAVRKLRGAIQSLNKEGRERLLAAFDVVNAQFKRLFTHLFGGGEAELQLIESEDPLDAGLEILARPPGKKPQTMTLLSGGEQALTAMALIFAVFLTNPAPICVLDEVDAPLDDHNVERFCNLMDEMARSTETRFVIITHNPITMARMDRLFGVTMAEQGVSQLVSVDLQTAEQIREAS